MASLSRRSTKRVASLLTLIALVVGASLSSTQTIHAHQSIVIQQSTQRGGVIDILGIIGDKQVELSCGLNSRNEFCRNLKAGEYFFRFASAPESVYTDCRNVIVYEITPQKTMGSKQGVFCASDNIDSQ